MISELCIYILQFGTLILFSRKIEKNKTLNKKTNNFKTVKASKKLKNWLKKHDASLTVRDKRYDYHFEDDKECRWIFTIELERTGHLSYTFNFGQSIAEGDKEPTIDDVLCCVQKYDVGTFEDFCCEFGYDPDSRKAERIYESVEEEYLSISDIFNEDELQELDMEYRGIIMSDEVIY